MVLSRGVTRAASLLLLGGGLLVSLGAFGEEVITNSIQIQPASAPVPSSAPAALPFDEINMLDVPRDYLADKFVRFVTGIDGFFGNDRNYQENNDSMLQMDITRVMGYGGEHQFVLSGRAKVHLPQAEKSLHLLLETDPDKNTANGFTQNQPATPGANTAPGSYGAGLRYVKSEEERWHFSTDGGLKFQGISTTPFARMRGSYVTPLEQWRIKAAETVFWFNNIGAGETTQLDFERPFSDPMLFRATSNATWLHDQQNFNLSQDFSVFQTLDERTKMQYQVGAVGASRPITEVNDYYISVLYRHRLHREWMYFDLSPQLHFPRARNFKSSGLLSMKLEILFDKSK
jgi:hypothetical protein